MVFLDTRLTKASKVWRVAVLAAAVVLALPVRAEAPQSCQPDTVIVLDASGSMAATDFPDGAPSRMDRARQSLATIINQVPPTRHVGLVTYGPGSRSNVCASASLKVAPQANFAAPILAEVERLRPDGRTPLTDGVRLAVDALGAQGGTVVLLTDGEETCHGNPCALAAKIREQRPDIVVHVIGYKLPSGDTSAASGAECLAQATNGLSLRADTAEELLIALKQVLGCQTLANLWTASVSRP